VPYPIIKILKAFLKQVFATHIATSILARPHGQPQSIQGHKP
jgi:hypothetical protein